MSCGMRGKDCDAYKGYRGSHLIKQDTRFRDGIVSQGEPMAMQSPRHGRDSGGAQAADAGQRSSASRHCQGETARG